MVCAVVLGGAQIDGLTDSKVLTKKRREALYDEIQKKFSCQKLDLYNEDEINKFQEYICHYDKAVYDEFIKKMIKSKNSEGGDHLFYDIVYRKVILNK